MTKDEGRGHVTPEVSNSGQMSESEVDLNIAGSFPASDPPAWTLGTDHVDDRDAER